MSQYLWVHNKYGDAEATKITKLYHTAIRELVRNKLAAVGGDWSSFVYDKSYDLITAKDFEKIAADVLAAGYRFDVSGVVSQKEAPLKYRALAGQYQVEATGQAKDGKIQVGHGDNVVTYPKNVTGIALYVQTTEEVMKLMMNGVPPDTVAVINDSGGTLTAPAKTAQDLSTRCRENRRSVETRLTRRICRAHQSRELRSIARNQ